MKKFRINKNLGYILFCSFSLIIFESFFSYYKQAEYTKNLNALYKDKADLVFDYIDLKQDEARLFANLYSKKIQTNLLIAYDGDLVALKKDLLDLKYKRKQTVLANVVIANTIRNVTFNRVKPEQKDNNDLIVFLADLIIGDLSVNCSKDARIRTIREEAFGDLKKGIPGQFAPFLALKAMENITKIGSLKTFWQFLPSTTKYSKQIKEMTSTDYDLLKLDFIKAKGDLDFFKEFEFLSVARINNDKDIAGEDIQMPNGSKNNESVQLHVVQGFNLLNQLALDPAFQNALLKEDNKINVVQTQFFTFIVFEAISYFFVFFLFATLYFLIEKKERLD